MLKPFPIALLTVALLTACSGSDTPEAPPTAGDPQSSSQATSDAPEEIDVSDMDAAQVAATLTAAGIPITSVFTVTAENDSNNLLGRPGGYTSKVVVTDSRVPASDRGEEGTVDNGAAIEVFDSEDAAQARADFIDAIRKESPILANSYDFVHGPVLVRVTGILTPDEAKAYDEALS